MSVNDSHHYNGVDEINVKRKVESTRSRYKQQEKTSHRQEEEHNSPSSMNVFCKIVTILLMIYMTIIMVLVLMDTLYSNNVHTSGHDVKLFHDNNYLNNVDESEFDVPTLEDEQISLLNNRRKSQLGSMSRKTRTINSMSHNSLHWKNCSYNLNYTETTRRNSDEYYNYFNDGMMAPVIGKIECQEIRFFQSYSNFKISFFGMFYSKVVSFIDQVNMNLFTQDSHLFYPITSTYQVITVEEDNYINICGDVSKLVSKLTRNGQEHLLHLYPSLNFTSCENLFCNVNESLYDPFNLYFRAQNYSQIYQNAEQRTFLYRDLHILSILTNRCQYCKSESQFRTRVQKQECPFMVNYPARSAERNCLGKNGFSVFYPYMSLDQYLQTTGNPFMCYCYENNIYSSRCDSIHIFIYPIYRVIMNPYLELGIEIVLFIVITFVLVLPLVRDFVRRGKYAFKDFDMILRALSVIPFWIFRLSYCIIKLTDGFSEPAQDDKSSRFVKTLISIAMDTIGFDYVFIPLVIKWNQTYQKIKLYTKQNADLSRKKTYLSSIIMLIFYYTITIGCGLVIILSAILLNYIPHIFDEDGSGAEGLIVMILVLIATPIIITLMGFFVLSVLIQRKLKQASDVSFVSTNYLATSITYAIVSMAQFIPTLISALTLYFGYDSILAALYFFSSTTMQITTDALEIYVIFLLADKISLKEFYYDTIWLKVLSPIIEKCFKKKITVVENGNSTTTTSGEPSDEQYSGVYYSKME
ncbi:predicted protein [Naegleria gruberi]|uniref:Predicted protein n=1 Tax=Naegleria gruberi TaxID=5762 RepID=D2VXR6_NAEGR|nr:uncharacterized protein NAEGRDRAFT_73843 [Naegleria gruberi]EFC38382.1 predicted protein [Naegleria gruberi]|eukprot:XP_002671126.1 predicted protein [Naegleria gruberi strain NEG-M]